MNKLIVAFVILFFINVIVGSIMEGGGDITDTRLLTAMTSSTTGVINVKHTGGFLHADYVVIENEKIRYIKKTATSFTIPATGGRGYDGTTQAAHAVGSMIYSPQANVLNSALGFNVASTSSTVGGIDVMFMLKDFFFVTIPKLVTWDFPQFRLHAWLTYIRIIFSIISIGFIVYLFYLIVSAIGNFISGIINP